MPSNNKNGNFKPLIILTSVFLLFVLILFVTYKYVTNKTDNTTIDTGGFFSDFYTNRDTVTFDDYNDMKLFAYKAKTNQFTSENKYTDFFKLLNTKGAGDVINNISGGLSHSEYSSIISEYPGDKKTLKYNLSIKYDDGTNVENGIVFINGINLGEFVDGVANGEFLWPKGIDDFNIIIRGDTFGDGLLNINTYNTSGEFISTEIIVKKSEIIEVDLSNPQSLEFSKLNLSFDKCTFEFDGICVEDTAKIKITSFKGSEANSQKYSLANMQATDGSDIFYLVSGGMSFIDVITNSGQILHVGKGKKVNISYKIGEEDLDAMSAVKKYSDLNYEGYWFFDKTTFLWIKKDAKITLDKENLLWNAEVSEIY